MIYYTSSFYVTDILLNEGSSVLFYVSINLIRIAEKQARSKMITDVKEILILLKDVGRDIVDADKFILECLHLQGKQCLGSSFKSHTVRKYEYEIRNKILEQKSTSLKPEGLGLAHNGFNSLDADSPHPMDYVSISLNENVNRTTNFTDDHAKQEGTSFEQLPTPASLRSRVLAYPWYSKESMNKISDLRALYRDFLEKTMIESDELASPLETSMLSASSYSPCGDSFYDECRDICVNEMASKTSTSFSMSLLCLCCNLSCCLDGREEVHIFDQP